MKLIEVSRDAITRDYYRATKFQSLFMEFAASDSTLVKVHFTEDEYKNAKSLYSAITSALRKHKEWEFKVRLIRGEVYLDKEI